MRLTLVLGIVALFMAIGVPVASATAYHAGYQVGAASLGTNVDGTRATEVVYATNPAYGACNTNSTVIRDFTNARQLELGTVSCNGASIDGSCGPSLVAFGETWTGGSNYLCFQGAGLSLGQGAIYKVERSGTGSTAYKG
jgi:hypothetical protein